MALPNAVLFGYPRLKHHEISVHKVRTGNNNASGICFRSSRMHMHGGLTM